MLRNYSMLLTFTMPIVFDPLTFAGAAVGAASTPAFGHPILVRGARIFPTRVRPVQVQPGHTQDADPNLDTG